MQTCEAIEVKGWDWQCLEHVALRAKGRVKERADDIDALSAESRCFLVEVGGEPVAFVGLKGLDVIGPFRYMWLIPFSALRAKHVRALRKALEEHRLGRVVAHVFSGDERFARLFGFEFHSMIRGVPTYIRSG